MTSDAPIPELIVEDLLLLLFDPGTETIRGEGSRLLHALAGGVIVDLAFQGLIEVDDSHGMRRGIVHATSTEPPVDLLLRDAWDTVARRPVPVQTLVLQIGPALRAAVLDRLVERGHLRREQRRFLGLIPTLNYGDSGSPHRGELLDATRAVLIGGAEPGRRVAALASLLSATGSLPLLHRDIPWSGTVQDRGSALETGEWGAGAAGEAVRRAVEALSATNLFVALTVINDRFPQGARSA